MVVTRRKNFTDHITGNAPMQNGDAGSDGLPFRDAPLPEVKEADVENVSVLDLDGDLEGYDQLTSSETDSPVGTDVNMDSTFEELEGGTEDFMSDVGVGGVEMDDSQGSPPPASEMDEDDLKTQDGNSRESPPLEIESPFQYRRKDGGIYGDLLDHMRKFKEDFLATINFGVRLLYTEQAGYNNVTYRDRATAVETVVSLFGEVDSQENGSHVNALGGFYRGRGDKIRPVTDGDKVRFVVALREPTMAGKRLQKRWQQQVAGLVELKERDPNQVPKVKNWFRINEDRATDNIFVTTDRIYAVPAVEQGSESVPAIARRKRAYTRRELDSDDDEPDGRAIREQKDRGSKGKGGPRKGTDMSRGREGGATQSDGVGNGGHPIGSGFDEAVDRKTTEARLGEYYPCSLLPDYAGSNAFKHVHSRLKQLNIKDEEDRRIPMQYVYDYLTEGALVIVEVLLKCYVMDDGGRRIYQLNAQSIRVVDRSPLEKEVRNPPFFYYPPEVEEEAKTGVEGPVSAFKVSDHGPSKKRPRHF